MDLLEVEDTIILPVITMVMVVEDLTIMERKSFSQIVQIISKDRMVD